MQLSKLLTLLCAATALAAPAPVGKSTTSHDVHVFERGDDAPPVLIVDNEKRDAIAEAVAEAVGDAVAEDLDNSISNILEILEPENFDVLKFAGALVAFIASPITKILPVRLAATLLPKLDINANLIISKIFIPNWASIPGYNTVFDVPGVDTGRAVWFREAEDRTEDDPVILYAHGGAYLIGFYPVFPWASNVIHEGVGNSRLSTLFLDYTLTLDAPYPQQLIEFTNTFNELSKTSKNIILMGDSAGVHLCLEFLRHQNYEEFPGVPSAVDNPTTGGIYLSPWVNMYPDPEDGTFKTNEGKDYITAEIVQRASEVNFPEEWMYTDPSTNPYKDDINWPSFMPESFVSRGENEILNSAITTWAGLANITEENFYTDPFGVHDSAVLTPFDSDILPNVVTYLKRMGL